MTFDLVLTESCNLNCRYCFENHKQYLFMQEDIIDIIHQFVNSYIQEPYVLNRNIRINFNGGETLLNYDVLKRIYYTLKDSVMEYSISTNFTLITQEMLEFFFNNNIHLHISIDGNKETNDTNRIFENGKGTFDTIINNIKNLKKKYSLANTSFSMVYTPDSIDQLYVNVKFLYDFGIRNIHASYTSNYEWKQEKIDEYIIQIEKISSLYKSAYNENDPFYFSILSNPIKNIITRNGKESLCGAFIDEITILPDGQIIPCLPFLQSDQREKFNFGSIYEGVNNDVMNAFIEKRKKASQTCISCSLITRCHNTCHFSFETDNDGNDTISGLNCLTNQYAIFEADKILKYLLNTQNQTFQKQYSDFLK